MNNLWIYVRIALVVLLGIVIAVSVSTQNISTIEAPVTMNWKINEPAPSLGREFTLQIIIKSEIPIEQVEIKSILPSQIRLMDRNLKWSGDLDAGKKVDLSASLMLSGTGRYSIAVEITGVGNGFVRAVFPINFIVSGSETRVSEEPFFLMDLDAAPSREARADLLQILAAHTEVCVDPDQDSGGYPYWNARISGKAEYVAIDGNPHPIRFAKLEIVNADPDAQYASLGLTSTDFEGNYSLNAVCQEPEMLPDIRVTVYSRCPDGFITGVCPTEADPDYTLNSDIIIDCPPGAMTVNLRTGQPVLNNPADDPAARAFSIFDAILQAALEGYSLLLGSGQILPPPYISVHFPAPTCYSTADDCIQIDWFKALHWDVILHEYYHFFSREAAKTKFNNGPGGEHNGSSSIPNLGKDEGIRMAWDEAIASFMAITVQLENSAGKFMSIPFPSIPTTGDSKFEEIEGTAWFFDLETVGQTHPFSQGYGSEFSVGGALFDLWDSGSESCGDPSVNCADRLGIPLQTIWNLWNMYDDDDVSKFFGRICGMLMSADPNTVPLFSDMFAMNRIAPVAYAPKHEQLLSRNQQPTFIWQPQGDTSAGCRNDHFVLGIFKRDISLANVVFVEPDLRVNSWTPTKDEWKSITDNTNYSTKYYWYVMGWNETTPRTPPVSSGFPAFVSNVQSFRLRPNIYASGMMGCSGKDATLFFNGFPLEIDPESNQYPFHGESSGNDYDGDPIYFILDGIFVLSQSMVRVDIDMYADPGYTTHIRTDRAEAYAWGEYFYDTSCTLTRNTSAGCVPLWFAIKFSENPNDPCPGDKSVHHGILTENILCDQNLAL